MKNAWTSFGGQLAKKYIQDIVDDALTFFSSFYRFLSNSGVRSC